MNLSLDGQDNVTAYQDPRSITTAYVRNGFGEVIQEQSPDFGATVLVRDPSVEGLHHATANFAGRWAAAQRTCRNLWKSLPLGQVASCS